MRINGWARKDRRTQPIERTSDAAAHRQQRSRATRKALPRRAARGSPARDSMDRRRAPDRGADSLEDLINLKTDERSYESFIHGFHEAP